ncbi:MAG: hypothetical protein AAF798_16215 [Bacteroidota bacterium]
MSTFRAYRDRTIAFQSVETIEDWHIKVYTISYQPTFGATVILAKAKQLLPQWISKAQATTLPAHKLGFLIVHEGSDGTWMLFYWWTGGEMLGNQLFFAPTDQPQHIEANPHPFGLVCIWELEIIQHERQAWIRHVLAQAAMPNINDYLQDYLSKQA